MGLDIDFSMAMYNRTGKYFIGRDLLDGVGDLFDNIYYWRLARERPPSGFFGKVVRKLQAWQIILNAHGGLFGQRLLFKPRQALLHLEPYTVLTTKLSRHDVVIVHDVGPVTHPDLFEKKLYPAYKSIFDELCSVGPHLIFVSRASQLEFERIYPAAKPAGSYVVYPAIRSDVARKHGKAITGIDGPFLLTTGSIGNRKNQLRSIRAFERSGLAARGVRYVLCGPTEPGHEAVSAAAAKADGVHLLQYVSDEELAWLYSNASGFVLASLLEGFGIPLAEAIGYGLIPAVTQGSVLEEVAGDGAVTLDAKSEESIASAMIALVDMSTAERAVRLVRLNQAISRFSIDEFNSNWREVIEKIEASNR